MSRPRQYSPEFVQEALRLLRDSGKSRRKIAADLGICPETLHKWELAYREDGSKRSTSEAAAQAEIERLRRELWLANEEREILKKAAAFFAREAVNRNQ